MRLCTLGAREARRRPGRAFLAVAGIALGLATVVATTLTAGSVRRAYRELFEEVAGESDLEVTSPGSSGFDPAEFHTLRVPGVKSIEPRIRGAVALLGPAGGVTAPLVGIDLAGGLEGWPLERGRHPAGDDEALVDASLADSLGLAPGQELRLWAPGGPARLTLAGILRPRAATASSGGALVVSLGSARRLLGLPGGHVSCLLVRAEDGADRERLRGELARRLPDGLTTQPPGAHAELAHATLRTAEGALAALGVLALLASALVVLNTCLLSFGERRRQFALLKTLGATRLQLFRQLFGEALALGLLGTVPGCAGGAALAGVLVGAMGRFLGVGIPALELRPGPFLLAGLLGPSLPVLAALWPAWRASRGAPLDELLPRRGQAQEHIPWAFGGAGLVLMAAGVGVSVALCRGQTSGASARALLSVALVLLLGGGVLSFPLLLAPLLRLFRAFPLRFEGRLALEQLARHPGRTGLTAGVLFLGVAVTVGFGHSLRGTLCDVRDWYGRAVVADFLVRGSMPDTSFVLAPALPEALGDELARLEGVAGVDRIAFLPARGNGTGVLVLARTFAPDQPLPLDLRDGEADGVRAGLMRGEVVVGAGLAGQFGLRRGDVLTLATPRGPAPLRVAGTAAEFAGGGAALYLEWEAARALLGLPGVHVFLVRARPGAAGALAPRLRAYCAGRGLLLQGNAELRGLIDRLLARVSAAVEGLMLLVFVVASLGVVNTLHMNVREQAATFAVLRALGLTPAQVRGLVLRQALLLAGLSLLPGALAGVGLAFVISTGSCRWAGVAVPFRPDLAVVAFSCAVGLCTALLAAVHPARRAARLPVLDALH